jgi:preprotein translocase subunit SecE
MKKASQRPKKRKKPKKKNPTSRRGGVADSNAKLPQEKPIKQKSVQSIRIKAPEKRRGGDRSIVRYIDKARQFLREAKLELKKVKWPTRKELLASTAVVIVLTLVMAFYFGLVDFGLVKIIKIILR